MKKQLLTLMILCLLALSAVSQELNHSKGLSLVKPVSLNQVNKEDKSKQIVSNYNRPPLARNRGLSHWDLNEDGKVNIVDVIELIDYLLSGTQPPIPAISSAYYYIGTSNAWIPFDATYKLDNGGGDVADNPVFTVDIPATGKDNWFKIYPQETMEVAEGDFWYSNFIGYHKIGANGMSGTFVEGPNDEDAFWFKIPASATANKYRLTFDMEKRTFEFEAIEGMSSTDTIMAEQLFKKCYDYVNGRVHIDGIDQGYTSFVRQLWNANVLTTDEAICGWGDPGIPEFNFNSYDGSHMMLSGFYHSLYACIWVCNEYLDKFSDYDATKSAEVRFLRALDYFYLLDCWGNVPLVTATGMDNPTQSSRVELFQWLEQELLSLRDGMSEPVTRKEGDVDYGRVDRDATNLLLARLYLNAQVYTGVARWTDAARYAKMVMDGPHKLNTTGVTRSSGGIVWDYTPYQMLFMGDNGNTSAATEAVFPLPHDGTRMDNINYGWGGTMFLIASTFDGYMHEDPFDPSATNGTQQIWAGNRARPELVRLFFPNDDAPVGQPGYMVAKLAGDDRALFNTSGYRTLENTSPSVFSNGYAVAKYNNFKTDGSSGSDVTFPDADFFLMRSAEAYLTYAEALARQAGGTAPAEAVAALNAIRSRAHAEQRTFYSLNQILDEWGREFYFEGRRRMDLIRFNRFGGITDYLWSWKGGAFAGRNFDACRNLFAIPDDAMMANSNMVQNLGYDSIAAQPIIIVLSTPVNTLVDLAETTGIFFEWSEPVYDEWPPLRYHLEVSPTNEWNISTDEAAADKTGATVADYAILSSGSTSCNAIMPAYELDKALNQICQWSEENVPATQTVYVRCATSAHHKTFYSNVVTLEVKPFYYIDLSNTAVELWYLVGEDIGSADWNNDPDAVGSGGLIPMYPVMGNEYDPHTGQGEIQYAGYFNAGQQFKFIKVPGDWDAQLNFTNVKDPAGFLSDEDGDNHNIGIVEAGCYLIRLNTAISELVIEKYEGTPHVCTQMAMPGEYQGWDTSANLMNGMSTSVENHDWYLKGVTYDYTELKFTADNSWDMNWGDTNFPYGIGILNGPSIPVQAGTYNVYFNDILGAYNFFSEGTSPDVPYVPRISSAYYYIGTSNDWTPYDDTYKLDNGGGDVYAYPVFTVTVPATGEDNLFMIYPQETMEAAEDDFWESVFIGYSQYAANGMSGAFAKGPNNQVAFSFKIPANIPADEYRLTFNMLNCTFTIEAIKRPETPDLWYLVGSCIGNGTWGNSPDGIGTALIPMYPEADNHLMLSYVGYFIARQGFKLIHKPGNWNEQWGMNDGSFVKNDGGSGNIEVATNGYYKLTYDQITETMTIEPYTAPVNVYNSMGMPGGYQGWSPVATLMTPMSTVVENHDWVMKDVTYSEYTELKFTANGSWVYNWGNEAFPYGIGVMNGANIPVEAGTYTVVFNDILGAYYFIEELE